MQWIIDIIMAQFSGIIMIWSGDLGTIPDGWVVCDGTNGTPDLRFLFVRSPGGGIPFNDVGGTIAHDHDGESQHHHNLPTGSGVTSGKGTHDITGSALNVGKTGQTNNIPPYRALYYIMKT